MSTNLTTAGNARGVLRVVPPAALEAAIKAQDQATAAAAQPEAEATMSNLASYIRSQFDMMKQHRNNPVAGWTNRLLDALRAVNGQYDPDKLAQIREFGGSEVYARIIAMKCRGATSLLRDVYLSPDRPWGLEAPEDPVIPPEITQNVAQLVAIEAQAQAQAGQPI
ncbi:MAG: hypothetical protein KGL39_54145, partial [Patescibacteria group bacterium]|nr:hypothetical protein [Patescibacteria group bacterium]